MQSSTAIIKFSTKLKLDKYYFEAKMHQLLTLLFVQQIKYQKNILIVVFMILGGL